VSVCLSVCLSVRTKTDKLLNINRCSLVETCVVMPHKSVCILVKFELDFNLEGKLSLTREVMTVLTFYIRRSLSQYGLSKD